jgi:hypothetical protein
MAHRQPLRLQPNEEHVLTRDTEAGAWEELEKLRPTLMRMTRGRMRLAVRRVWLRKDDNPVWWVVLSKH